jgi:hypothetical protein
VPQLQRALLDELQQAPSLEGLLAWIEVSGRAKQLEPTFPNPNPKTLTLTPTQTRCRPRPLTRTLPTLTLTLTPNPNPNPNQVSGRVKQLESTFRKLLRNSDTAAVGEAGAAAGDAVKEEEEEVVVEEVVEEEEEEGNDDGESDLLQAHDDLLQDDDILQGVGRVQDVIALRVVLTPAAEAVALLGAQMGP